MSLNVHHLNGNLLVGSSHFYVDTLTNKVGITTTNPDAGLHVNSNAYVNTDFRVGADIAMNVTSGRITAGSFDGDGSLLSGINSDSGSWVKDDANSKIYVSNTSHKVGIGTTTPRALLDVSGPVDVPAILTSGASASEGDIAVISGEALQIGHWDSGASTFTNRIHISGSGNVGIGTTSPQQKLEVHGNILLGENQVKSFIHGGNSVAVSSDADVLIVADSNDTSGAVGSNSIIFGAGSAIDTDNRDFTYAQAYPNDVPRVELMRLTADSIAGEAGRLGLGTASPEEKIHFHANHEYIYQRFSTTAAGTTDKFDIACWNSTRSNGDHGVMFVNRANTDMRFINNNSEVMRIKNDGKVGIGRYDPQEKLHVVGNIAVNWSNDRRIIMNYDNSYRQGIEMDAGTRTLTLFSTGGGGDGGALVFKTREATGSSDSDYGTQRMRINKNGSIVIGDVGGYATNGYTDAQLTIGGTHNQSSGYNTSNQIKLFITGGNNDGSSPYYIMCEDENGYEQMWVKGATSDAGASAQLYIKGEVKMASAGDTYAFIPYNDGWLRLKGAASGQGRTYVANSTHTYTSLAVAQLWANGNYLAGSDDRIKHFEEEIPNALELIQQLKPYKYKKTSKIYDEDYTGDIGEDWKWEIGLIAQDVEKIPYLEHAVSKPEDSPSDTYGLNYTEFIGVCIQGIKDLSKELQETKAELNNIEERFSNHTHPLEPHTHPLEPHTHPLEPHTHSDLVEQLAIERANTDQLQQRVTLLEHSHTALLARLEALETNM